MAATNQKWVERYAQRLNDGSGDLSKLSADERKHLRLLLREYELSLQLVGLEEGLSQAELPLNAS